MMNNRYHSPACHKYARAGHHDVQGWLEQLAIEIILTIDAVQKSQSIYGPVCEIGVHHGRLFVLLHLLTTPGSRSVGWDLFEEQSSNIDHSGYGDADLTRTHLQTHGAQLENVRLVTCNSLSLKPENVIDQCSGYPRLFSVDGGHTPEITCNDLVLAAHSISDGGVVILDDYFNQEWPGVSQGTCEFFSASPGKLIPFGIGGNKLFLTNNRDLAASYQEHLKGIAGTRYRYKLTEMYGSQTVVLWEEPRTYKRYFSNTVLWRSLSRTRFGKAIRRAILSR